MIEFCFVSFHEIKSSPTQPTPKHAEVARFVTPDAFTHYSKIGQAKGFLLISATPLTRSSYHADQDFANLQAARRDMLQAQ